MTGSKTLLVVRALVAMTGAISMSGCGSGSGDLEHVSVDQAEVRNGDPVPTWASGSDPRKSVVCVQVSGGCCTGTVIRPSWVLTAGHCTNAASVINTGNPIDGGAHVVDAAVKNTVGGADLGLLHLSTPFTNVPASQLIDGPASTVIGHNLTIYGFGATNSNDTACTPQNQAAVCPAGWVCNVDGVCMLNDNGVLRSASLTPAFDPAWGPEIYHLPRNTLGQQILPGDSGGPSFYNDKLASVHITSGGDQTVGSFHDWIDTPSRTSFTTGDFNHDGVTDYIATTPTGSQWYYSVPGGTWRLAYDRPDLKLGIVKYTPGDFDGDGWTDLIITVSSGSFFYYSNPGPDNVQNPWLSLCPNLTTQFQLGHQEFVVGDFDGNGKTDFVVDSGPSDTPAGSSFYYSMAQCSWNTTAYVRPDLTWGKVKYTPGDFNNDGKTDLIIATTGGTFWYYSLGVDAQGVGHWATPYIRTDLKVGEVNYTVADYDGDGRSDMIITVPAGSFWYYSRVINGADSWYVPYARTDLTWGKVSYTPGDFDGDGRADVAITGSFGTYWYYSTQTPGTFSIPNPLATLTRGAVQFTVGNFNGSGGKDMIFTTPSGSDWNMSIGQGAWQTSQSIAADSL